MVVLRMMMSREISFDVDVEEEEGDDIEEEDGNPHFVRALAVEMRINMLKQTLEKPFDTET